MRYHAEKIRRARLEDWLYSMAESAWREARAMALAEDDLTRAAFAELLLKLISKDTDVAETKLARADHTHDTT